MLMRLLILGSFWGGGLALVVASFMPWMKLPGGSASGVPIALTPSATWYFRLGCLGIAFLIVLSQAATRDWDDAVRKLTAVWFVLLLAYPYFAIVWDAGFAGEASWLQMQHENLTWLGGDLWTSGEFADTPLKVSIYPVDPPRRLTIFRIPSCAPWQLELSSLSDLLDWLGYTEAFCQFIGKGWFVSLGGAASVVIGACGLDREKQRARIIRTIGLMLPVGLVVVACAWSLPFVAGFLVSQAEELTRRGDYDAALHRLEWAARVMPVLRHDTSFVAQQGRLGHILGRDQIEVRLYNATRLEAEGRFSEANDLYRALIQDAPPGSPVRREGCRALLRSAIHDLNSGLTDTAEEQLWAVLAAEPTNLKANFTLQFACLKSGRRNQVRQLVDQFVRVYGFFQTPMKDCGVSAAHHNAKAAALDANAPADARRAYRKALP